MDKFQEQVKNLLSTFDRKKLDISDLKAENFIESILDWSEIYSIDEVKEWFLRKQKELSLEMEDIPLHNCRGWKLNHDTGYVEHDSGEFFYIQGIRVKSSKSREVGDQGWDQPMMTQVGFNGGILGLIRKKINGIPYYLIEAKAEPGNPDGIQLSPTLQATFSNLKAAHKEESHIFQIFLKNIVISK